MLHLIDDNGMLVGQNELTEYLFSATGGGEHGEAAQYLHRIGVNYHVVCIFGGQSSGKSTLLNELFGTQFQTLDPTGRRGQTTRGAFLSSASETDGYKNMEQPLLLMDLEGTDGLERGENQNFERQLSLFGLSAADTLIVNMWAVDVGRINAANLSLLRTIFEVNLHLFLQQGYQRDEKPTLLVVLRDFTEEDPAPMKDAVQRSFNQVWLGIKKPQMFADATFDDFFRLRCVTLPHYKLQHDVFIHALKDLRQWFCTPSSTNYLFQRKGMLRDVPLEGLPSYLSSCWKAILTSKDLNIPSQREMLAQHRCKEITGSEIEEFNSECQALRKMINDGDPMVGLVQKLQKMIDAREASYADLSKLYNDEVVAAHLQLLHKELVRGGGEVLEIFSKRVAKEVAGVVETQAHALVERSVQQLMSAGQKSPFEKSNSNLEGELSLMVNNAACREAVSLFWEDLCLSLTELLRTIQQQRPPSVELFGRFAPTIQSDDLLRSCVTSAITRELVEQLRNRLVSMTSNIPDTLHRVFEKGLTHTPEGRVRVVRSAAALEKLVPGAQQGAIFVLAALLYFRLEVVSPSSTPEDPQTLEDVATNLTTKVQIRNDPEEEQFFLVFRGIHHPPVYPSTSQIVSGTATEGVKQENILITATTLTYTFQQLKERMDFTVESMMRTIEASRQQSPWWVYVALAVLCFDKIVGTSPLLLAGALALLALLARNQMLELWVDLQDSGPAWLSMAMGVASKQFNELTNNKYVQRLTNVGYTVDHFSKHYLTVMENFFRVLPFQLTNHITSPFPLTMIRAATLLISLVYTKE
eukprot:gene13376-9203_t